MRFHKTVKAVLKTSLLRELPALAVTNWRQNIVMWDPNKWTHSIVGRRWAKFDLIRLANNDTDEEYQNLLTWRMGMSQRGLTSSWLLHSTFFLLGRFAFLGGQVRPALVRYLNNLSYLNLSPSVQDFFIPSVILSLFGCQNGHYESSSKKTAPRSKPPFHPPRRGAGNWGKRKKTISGFVHVWS